VIGHPALLVGAEDVRVHLGAGDDPVDALGDLLVADGVEALAGGQGGGLVHHRGDVGARQAHRAPGEAFEVDVGGHRLAPGVDLEDGQAAGLVGHVDHDLAVEAALAHQGRVQDVGPVGGGHQDHPLGRVEAVELDQQLVEGGLALGVHRARGPGAAHGIDLVDEHDGRRGSLGLLEQVAHP